MATILLYSTGKRTNSTLVPEFTAGDSYESTTCEFFEPLDILNPTIILREEALPNLPRALCKYNYVYIQSPLERYYWITKWTRDGGLWYANCTVDYLASFRTDILNTKQYVLRANNSNLWNNYIPDTLYGYNFFSYSSYEFLTATGQGRNWYAYQSNKLTRNPSSDYNNAKLLYVVCNATLNLTSLEKNQYLADGEKKGSTNTYVFPIGALPYILSNLKRNYEIDSENVNLGNFIQRMFVLPIQPLETHYLIPNENPAYQRKYLICGSRLDAETDITKGDAQFPNLNKTYCMIDMNDTDPSLTDYTISGSRYFRPLNLNAVSEYTFNCNVKVYKSAIDFENGPNYATYTLLFEPFGEFSLDSTLFVDGDELQVKVTIDHNTGNAQLKYAVISDKYNVIWYPLSTTNIALDVQWQSVVNNANAWSRQHVAQAFDVVGASINNLTAPIKGAQHGQSAVGKAINGIIAGVQTLPAVGEAIYNFVEKAPIRNVSNVGGTIGCSIMTTAPTVYIRRLSINGRDDARFGRPVCQNIKLSEIGDGICVCQNATFGGAGIGNRATSIEKTAIENALNGGIYLE